MSTTATKTTTKNKGSKIDIHVITFAPMLAVIAFGLMYVEFSIPIMPSFLKFDFSDMPALLGSFAYGPLCGVFISLIKNLLHLPFSSTSGIGELANFLVAAMFVVPAGWFYKARKTKKRALFGAMLGSCLAGILSLPVNFFIVYPFYFNFMPKETVIGLYQAILPVVSNIFSCLLIFNVPFTIVKFVIATIITMLIYKPLSPILKGRATNM